MHELVKAESRSTGEDLDDEPCQSCGRRVLRGLAIAVVVCMATAAVGLLARAAVFALLRQIRIPLRMGW